MIIYDVEVIHGPTEVSGGWGNPAGMEFGTCVAWCDESRMYHFFGPDQREEFIDWLITSKATVVGFNSKKFDSRVVMADNDLASVPWLQLDLLEKIVCAKFSVDSIPDAVATAGPRWVFDGSLNLDTLCHHTIGERKCGHGAHAPVLIQQGKWAEVFKYNLHDVRLTRKLLEFGRSYGYVVDGDARIIEVEW